MMIPQSGKVQTVLGIVEPESLGITLPHEHILLDNSNWVTEPVAATERHLARQPLMLQNLGWILMNYDKSLDNSRLTDEETAIDEIMLFKRNGGLTIADVTPRGLGNDPLGLVRVARATGVNIVMGTAYYEASTHPSGVEEMTEQQIATEFVNDIQMGIGETGVRAGLIGEIGCSWPLARSELKVLRAAAMAQRETGALLMIHPGRNESAPLEIIEVLVNAGADITHTVICHISRTMFDSASRLELAGAGCYLEYDLFSHSWHYFAGAAGPTCMPSDPERVDQICELIAAGYERQILVSHDICWKMYLSRYGGHGYSYILKYGVPLMRWKGMSEDQIHTILVDNTHRALQFL